MERIVVDANGLGYGSDRKCCIQRESCICVKHNVFALIAAETWGLHVQGILAHR